MTLAEATERVYAAFADMPRPKQLWNEYGDLEAGEVKQLTTYPLRELSPGLMRSYMLDAVYTVGTWDDFRYFLPRLLQLMASGDLEPDRIVGRLQYGREKDFPLSPEQQVALHAFALEYWNANLVMGVMPYDMDALLPFGLSRLEMLRLWLKHPQGRFWLANSIVMGFDFSGELDPRVVLSALEAAFFTTTDPADAQTISDAILILEAQEERL